jgi:hypothetical protein
MVIDLTSMTAKRLDLNRQGSLDETGNRWRDLYPLLQATNTGLIPIGGGCPTVGIPDSCLAVVSVSSHARTVSASTTFSRIDLSHSGWQAAKDIRRLEVERR